MGEVNLLKFVTEHVFLVALAVVSGSLLIWPALRRSAGGAISTLEATLLINQQNALVLDVRDAAEYAQGHVLNARNLPAGELAARASEIDKFKAKPVIVVCESGTRSDKAAATLRKQGFGQVVSLGGGVAAWRQAGLPLEK
jgi:rhodanese-related sulfurtransferase